MSRMTLTAMSLIRNPVHPPNTPFFDRPFLTHFNNDINMKIAGYLPWGLPVSSVRCIVIGLKTHMLGQRPTQEPSAGARMRGA